MMKMADMIIKELWGIKDEIAKEHGYDIDRLVSHFIAKRSIVSMPESHKNKPEQDAALDGNTAALHCRR
jgi:hypothetical protein